MAGVFIHVTGNDRIERSYNPCLIRLCKYMELREVVIDGNNRFVQNGDNGDVIVFCKSEMNWLWHYIAESRDSIFKNESLVLSRNNFPESCILYGKLSFWYDGTNKITAYFPQEGAPALRISTDLEVIQYTADQYRSKLCAPDILWYRDPQIED